MAEAKSYAQRNRQGSDWFSHDDGKTSASDHKGEGGNEVIEKSDGEVLNSPRSHMIKPVCNSNQWYKHDKSDNNVEAGAPGSPASGKEKAQVARQSGCDWYAHEAAKNEEKTGDVKMRVGSAEGKAYCRRDKTGSCGSWYAHEHDGEPETAAASPSPRVHTTEGSNNASRMRSQSENWFNHDGKVSENGPHHSSKGHGSQPQSSNMHDIFHMQAK